jgi:hypothetical protein
MPSQGSTQAPRTSKEKFEEDSKRYIKNLRGEAHDPDIHILNVDQNYKPV